MVSDFVHGFPVHVNVCLSIRMLLSLWPFFLFCLFFSFCPFWFDFIFSSYFIFRGLYSNEAERQGVDLDVCGSIEDWVVGE